MQEFINKQLPGLIQEGVKADHQNLLLLLPAITLDEIKEVVENE
jgi:hypothetical protein